MPQGCQAHHFFLGALCSGMAFGQAHAQTQAQPAPALDRVSITAARPASLPIAIPTTTESVSADTIERSINATDAEDALKYLPSLLVRKRYVGDFDHAVLSTRASGTGNSARSLVYADGILLSNLLGNGASFTPRWGLVTPEEIERVDVLYGPFSAAYAGNSAGAVVDYVTRMPTRFEAHLKLAGFTQDFSLYRTDERFGGHQASASLGDASGDWSWWLGLNRLESRSHPLTFATRTPAQASPGAPGLPVTGAVAEKNRFNDDWLLLGAGSLAHTVQDHAKLKLAYRVSSDVTASYLFGLWNNETRRHASSYLRDAAGNSVALDPGNLPASGNLRVNIDGRDYTLLPGDFAQTRERAEHHIHGFTLKRHAGGVWDWAFAASTYRMARDELRAWAPTTAPFNAMAGRLTDRAGTGWDTLALKGTWRPEGSAHVVEFGLQREAYRLRNRVFSSTDWRGGAPAAQTARFEGDTELASLWAQDAWRIAPRWRAVLGARFEHWRADRGRTDGYAHPGRSEQHVSPKAALGWRVDDDWTLRLSTGRAVRMPTVSELFQGSTDALGQLHNGDPLLRPERSQTTELSAERQLSHGLARATVFFEDTKDALYSQTNTLVTPNVTNVQNVDRIETRGIELALQTADAPVRGLDLMASVTYADSTVVRNDRMPASVGKQQQRVPRWRASLLAVWRATERFTASLGVRHGGPQFNTADNSDPNGARYHGASAFTVADLRLHYRFDRRWSGAFGIDNLTDATYWNFHPYPQRSFNAELRFDL